MDGIDAGKKHPYLTLSSLLLSPQNVFPFFCFFLFFLFGLSPVREKAFSLPVCSWPNHQNDKESISQPLQWLSVDLTALQSSSLQVGEWAIKRDSTREGKWSVSMWDVLKHAGGVFSDVIKTQSQMQDKWIAPRSGWVTSVVEWQARGLCCVEETHFSCASNGKKTTTHKKKFEEGGWHWRLCFNINGLLERMAEKEPR